jgi:hypothetical protein
LLMDWSSDGGGGALGRGELLGGAAGEDAGAAADLIAGPGDVGGELAEAADGALEIRDESADRGGHTRRLRLRGDVAGAEREVAGGDAVDQRNHAFAPQEHALEPEVEEENGDRARGRSGEQRLPPDGEGHLRNEPEQQREQHQAGDDEDPHLSSPSEVAHLHRVLSRMLT